MKYTTSAEVANLDLENRRVTVCVSTQNPGRDGAIVLSSAWERDLATYLKNPVLLWMHPLAKTSPKDPWVVMGRSAEIDPREDGLWVTFEYHDKTQQARDVWELVANGMLRAYSVYWAPLQIVTLTSSQSALSALPEWARSALVSGLAREVHTRVELLEISQVVVGVDPDAVTRARAAGVSVDAISWLIEQANERGTDMKIETGGATQEGMQRGAEAPVEGARAQGRMNVQCDWYDGTAAEKLETIDGVTAVLGEVMVTLASWRSALVADEAEDIAEVVDTDAERAAGGGRGRAGKAISASRKAKMREAVDYHERGIKVLNDMLDETDDEEEDDSRAARAQTFDPRAAILRLISR